VMMTDDWVTDPFLAAVRDFERTHPGVRVDVGKTPISHMLDSVTAAIKTGVAPDVVQAHAFSAAAQGLAQQVDDLWADKKPLDTADFLPGAIDDVTWAGHLYGVPLDTNALFLIYDADQFDAAKVVVPQEPFTFASFEAAARSLSAPDGSRRALAIPQSTWWTYGWIKANGGEVLEVGDDGKAQLSLDDPKVIGALDYLRNLVKANLAFAPGAADSHSGDALALFRSGSASTLASGSWDIAVLKKDPAGEKYRSTPMPAGAGDDSGSVMGGSSMFIPTGSTQRELAFEFMAHLVSDKYALRLAKEEGRLPVRPRVYDDSYFDTPDLRAVIEQLPSASPFKLSAFPEAHDVFKKAVDEVLRGGSEAGPVMAEAQRQAQALLTK
jgi:multiple sugar transport system substrate-binding protein